MTNLESLFVTKMKSRHDSYTDQCTDQIVSKIFLVAGIVMGINWFTFPLPCLLPLHSHLTAEFIGSSCWIKGFYIHPQMVGQMQESGYYGIPTFPDYDGIWDLSGDIYRTKDRFTKDQFPTDDFLTRGYISMQKYFFIHYQWMPICIASLSLIFYLPYLIYRVVNTDIISLHLTLQRAHVSHFFSPY